MSFHIGGDSQKIGWVFSISLNNILLWFIQSLGGNPGSFTPKAGMGLLIIDKRTGRRNRTSIVWSGEKWSLVWKGQRISFYDALVNSFGLFFPVYVVA